jgi:hypothetical protein
VRVQFATVEPNPDLTVTFTLDYWSLVVEGAGGT